MLTVQLSKRRSCRSQFATAWLSCLFLRKFKSDGVGYVEVAPSTDRPAFSKISLVQGFALFVTKQKGTITFGSDQKFARETIIEQIAKYGVFCMQHGGVCKPV